MTQELTWQLPRTDGKIIYSGCRYLIGRQISKMKILDHMLEVTVMKHCLRWFGYLAISGNLINQKIFAFEVKEIF